MEKELALQSARDLEPVRELLMRHPQRLTRKSVENAAWELGLSRATMYRAIDRYRATRAVSGLMLGQRGRPTGVRISSQISSSTIIRQNLFST
jgi:putative transposase